MPATNAHPAYLYWQGPEQSPDLPFQVSQTFSDTWYEVVPEAAALLDAAIADAHARVEDGGQGLQRDPVSALVGLLASPPPSGGFVIGVGSDGAIEDESDPWIEIPLVQSEAVVDGFIATLHNWRPVDPTKSYVATSYDVWTSEGNHLFAV